MPEIDISKENFTFVSFAVVTINFSFLKLLTIELCVIWANSTWLTWWDWVRFVHSQTHFAMATPSLSHSVSNLVACLGSLILLEDALPQISCDVLQYFHVMYFIKFTSPFFVRQKIIMLLDSPTVPHSLGCSQICKFLFSFLKRYWCFCFFKVIYPKTTAFVQAAIWLPMLLLEYWLLPCRVAFQPT